MISGFWNLGASLIKTNNYVIFSIVELSPFVTNKFRMSKPAVTSSTPVGHQNPTKGGVGFSGIFHLKFDPPYYPMTLKCHNFCSICPPVRLKRYVRQKFSLFQAVPFFFEFVCFPPFFTPFPQKEGVFKV